MIGPRTHPLFYFILLLGWLCPEVASAKSPAKTITHSIQSGDTLSGLAKHYGSTVAKIMKRNKLQSSVLRPGRTLRIRATKNQKSSKSSIKKKSSKRKKGAKKRKKKGKRRKFSPRKNGDCSYTVRKGDSLWRIARKKKTTIAKLKKWNGKKAKRLRPGRTLKVCYLKVGGGAIRQSGAVRLPKEGPGFRAPRRNRVWGQLHAIEAMILAAKEVSEKFVGTHPLFIGDVSFEKGGYMPPHVSHRRGIDADISYFVRGNPKQGQFALATNKTLDAEKTWHFMEALIRTGHVHQFYVEHSLQKVLYEEAEKQGYSEEDLGKLFEYPRKIGRGKKKKIRHIKGHDDHLHVRFILPSALPLPKPSHRPEDPPGRDPTQDAR